MHSHVGQAAATVLALNPLDPHSLLHSFGLLGLFAILFAETGLLIGFFLPGDSLLFTAGVLASTSAQSAAHLPLPLVLLASAAGALLGAQVGYLLGRGFGPAWLDRPDRPRLSAAVGRSRVAMNQYGVAKAIVLARFIPLVRTVANPLAGTIDVPLRSFTLWQVIGGLGWTIGIVLAGYALGSSIPGIDRYLLPIVVVVIVVSLVPVARELRRQKAGASAG